MNRLHYLIGIKPGMVVTTGIYYTLIKEFYHSSLPCFSVHAVLGKETFYIYIHFFYFLNESCPYWGTIWATLRAFSIHHSLVIRSNSNAWFPQSTLKNFYLD